MSLLAADSRLPSFVLRKHTKPVTAVAFVKAPVATRRKLITKDTLDDALTLKSFLISGDEDGRVLVWDLATRRPVLQKQCHKMHILTIRQLGVRDGAVDHRYFGLILTHGRDNCVKFWRLFEPEGQFVFDEVYELPENALNFSNVDVMGDKLVTPNTMNSNAFDVYDIGFLTEDELDDHRLKRDLEAVDVFQRAVESGYTFAEFKIQREDDTANRVDKFGIIMKLLWVDSQTLFVGYESGHVASLQLDLAAKSVKILNITNHHYPNPVLSLSYDPKNNIVSSSSIKSEIVIHNLSTRTSTPIKLDKFGKISSIMAIDDKYILSSWNGVVKFFTLNTETLTLDYTAGFTKPKGMIAGDLNIIGNIQGSEDFKKKNVIKPSAMSIVDGGVINDQMRPLLGRRDAQVIVSSFLAVGYDDGTISVYSEV